MRAHEMPVLSYIPPPVEYLAITRIADLDKFEILMSSLVEH